MPIRRSVKSYWPPTLRKASWLLASLLSAGHLLCLSYPRHPALSLLFHPVVLCSPSRSHCLVNVVHKLTVLLMLLLQVVILIFHLHISLQLSLSLPCLNIVMSVLNFESHDLIPRKIHLLLYIPYCNSTNLFGTHQHDVFPEIWSFH